MRPTIALAVATLMATGAFAQNAGEPAVKREFTKGDIRIVEPWARATPGGAKVAAGYVTITNAGKAADRLVGGSAIVSGTLEIHDMTMTDGVMRMRHLDKGIELKPGVTVVLKPGGLHVMFMELKQPIKLGETVKGSLMFEKAGTIEIEFDVAPIGAPALNAAPASAGSGAGGGAPQHKHH